MDASSLDLNKDLPTGIQAREGSRKRTLEGGDRDSPCKKPQVEPTVYPEESQTDKPKQDYIVIHRVQCSARGEGHDGHIQRDYLDVPRLYAGDSKASALRGESPCPDVSELIAETKGIKFIVYRHYNCNEYHGQIMRYFESLPMPKVDLRMRTQIRPYLFSLAKDCPLAAPQFEEITIISEGMSTAMIVVEQMYPDHFLGWRNPGELRNPYLHFFHGRRLLQKLVDENQDVVVQKHITALLKYVIESVGHIHEEAEALFARGLVNRVHFTKLFGPNEVVVMTKEGNQVGMLLKNFPRPNVYPINLDCWSWGFDGVFRKEFSSVALNLPATGNEAVSITDLEVYPLRFANAELEEKLKRRGHTFWDCRVRKFISYHAPVRDLEFERAPPRYMIDIEMYRRMHSDEELKPRGKDDLSQAAMESDDPPDHPFLLLLPAKMNGYGFHDKKWRSLLVEYISPVQWNKRAFDRVVLKSQKKELIKALVTVHLEASRCIDVIDDKGKGLIMLFHGGPGTGKTLTAESVADLAQRPLYRVTCGDIGTEAESVEKYLESVLYIGAIWGCVLLLDEADVFLEERTQADLQRNALVSVFLRVLEYYEGILILTTNRVGIFDEAFKSRVQLSLYYPKLDDKGRWEIWRNMIHNLPESIIDVELDELKDKLDVLARYDLNGRQIRNTVKTARQLAQYRREILQYSHFETAIEAAAEFEEYLRKTHGHTDEEYARELRTRH